MEAWSVVGYAYDGEAWCANCLLSPSKVECAIRYEYNPLFASDELDNIVCHTCYQGLGDNNYDREITL